MSDLISDVVAALRRLEEADKVVPLLEAEATSLREQCAALRQEVATLQATAQRDAMEYGALKRERDDYLQRFLNVQTQAPTPVEEPVAAEEPVVEDEPVAEPAPEETPAKAPKARKATSKEPTEP
jgi:chromosome segregation ATPase